MNEVLIDLRNAVNSIPEFYYSIPTVRILNDDLQIDIEEIKNYERRS